jgi:photosystem II stability/assembly factor-like uncharacterized protein
LRPFVSAALLVALWSSARAQSAPVLEPQQAGTTARLQAVSVVSASVVWASGARGTYVRTLDGGRTWTAAVVPGADSLEFRDVHAFDADRAVLLAAGPGERSRLYRTENGGRTWELAFTNKNPDAFYDCIDFRGSFGVAVSDAVQGRFPLLRTRNGGRSWEPFEPPGYHSIQAIEGEGAFAASGTCLVVLGDGGFQIATAKGGRVLRFTSRAAEVRETPVIRNLPMAGIASLAYRSERIGVAAGGDLAQPDAFTDNVAVTRDGGRSWTLGGRPPFPGPIYGLAYSRGPGGPVLVAVGPRGAAWSPDDGAAWKPLTDASHWGLGFAPRGVGWLVGPEGRVTRVSFGSRGSGVRGQGSSSATADPRPPTPGP